MWDFWVAFAIGISVYGLVFEWILEEKGYKKQGYQHSMNFGWFLLWLMGWVGIIALLLARNKRVTNRSLIDG